MIANRRRSFADSRATLTLLALLSGPIGCAPSDLQGSVEAWVYAAEGDDPHHYVLQRLPLENLESLRELRGRDVHFRANARLANRELDERVEFDRGGPFTAEWTTDADGVVVPLDESSLQAMTAYLHLDRTASWLRARGYVPRAPLDIYYFPAVQSDIIGDLRTLFSDNAAFSSECHCFLLLPSFALSEGLPLLANAGVIAHEFGHSVVHQQMFGALASVPDGEGFEVAKNHLGSMHEGLADLLALAVTGDVNVLLLSLGPGSGSQRDVTVPRSFTPNDKAALEGKDPPVHDHGSTLARTLFEAWPRARPDALTLGERDALLAAILATLADLRYGVDFRLTDFADRLIEELPSAARPEACAVFARRLAALETTLPRCEAP